MNGLEMVQCIQIPDCERQAKSSHQVMLKTNHMGFAKDKFWNPQKDCLWITKPTRFHGMRV
jgi:hypothetical protein